MSYEFEMQVLELPRTCLNRQWALQPAHAYSVAVERRHIPLRVLHSSYHCCSLPGCCDILDTRWPLCRQAASPFGPCQSLAMVPDASSMTMLHFTWKMAHIKLSCADSQKVDFLVTAGKLPASQDPAKTRRWGSAVQGRPTAVDRATAWRNSFPDVALQWAAALLRDADADRQGIDMFGRDALVLGRLLVTLVSLLCVHC